MRLFICLRMVRKKYLFMLIILPLCVVLSGFCNVKISSWSLTNVCLLVLVCAVSLCSMIKLRHLRASCADLFCAFRLAPDDRSVWVVERLNQKTKLYKCYNLYDKDITMYVNQEQLVYEADFE